MSTRLSQFSVLYSFLNHSNVKREEIVTFQNKQLHRLVAHAYENVSYYRKLFDRERIKPDDIQGIDDLPKIPITSKKDIQLLPVEEIVARGVNHKKLVIHTTSGSSGEPLAIRRTWLEECLLSAFRLRIMRYFGQRLTDLEANISLIRSTEYHERHLPLRILQTLGLYRNVRINCLLAPEDIVRALRHLRPNMLTGFAGVISRISHFVGYKDRLTIRPRFIRVSGDVLTPLMRSQIAEAFSAPVFDVYASHEFGTIAWECKETGKLHVCDDNLIVEVLKDGRPAATGERGEVVGTNLHSFAMPFIRYRLGDVVTKGLDTCRCGQPFSTIRAVQGRMVDYFLLPDGRTIHPFEIVLILVQDAASWIQQYQLVQEREDSIILRVVPSIAPTSQELVRLEQSVTAVLGQDIEFRVILVPDIQIEPNGKFRVSRSLVKSAYDEISCDHPQTIRSYPAGRHGDEPR